MTTQLTGTQLYPTPPSACPLADNRCCSSGDLKVYPFGRGGCSGDMGEAHGPEVLREVPPPPPPPPHTHTQPTNQPTNHTHPGSDICDHPRCFCPPAFAAAAVRPFPLPPSCLSGSAGSSRSTQSWTSPGTRRGRSVADMRHDYECNSLGARALTPWTVRTGGAGRDALADRG